VSYKGVVLRDPSLPRLHEILAHERVVRAIARRLLRDDNAADDVVQETWLRALRSSPRRRRSLRSWLVRIARNVALNIQRSDTRRLRREEAVARAEGVRQTDAYEIREQNRRIAVAVLRLDEPYRTTILLRFYRGWTHAAIARRARVSPAAVRKRLRRAFALLRASLKAKRPPEPHPHREDPMWSLGLPYESPAPS